MSKEEKIDYKYVYEKSRKLYRVVLDHPTYNKETKKTTHHYETVGKAKEKGGEIEFGSKYAAIHNIEEKKSEMVPAVKQVIPSGEVLVLKDASEEVGLYKTLVTAFGKEKAEKIEALVFFLLCTGDAMMDAEEWCSVRNLKSLSSPRISELLPALCDTACSSFFSAWVKEKAKDKSVCYDITSVSTYSTDMDIAEYGYNRDHEKWLKQINLAMVTDKESHIPLAFRPLNGSLSDSQTLIDTVREFEGYGAKPYGFVMDRGFWKQTFLDMLHEKGVKFTLPVPSSVGWATKLIKEHKNDVFSSYYEDDEGNTTFCYTVYDPQKEGRQVWAHIYYSPAIETAKKEKFVKEYMARKKELEEDKPNEKYRAFYDEYFTVSKKGRGGKIHVTDKKPLNEILDEKIFGYWVLYTDMEKDGIKALIMYRERPFIEAGFDDLKGATDMKRLRTHKSESIYGRLFIQFCAQVLRTELRNKIRSFDAETKKYASSPDALLKRVKSYSKVKFTGKYKPQYSAPTKGQRLIFKGLGIDFQDSANDGDEGVETERNFSE